MENKRLTREFLRFLLPSVASMVSLSCYILADTYFVAAGVGSIGLAGLNIALPAYSLINALGLTLGVGAGVMTAVCRARSDATGVDSVFRTVLVLGLTVGAVLTLGGVLLADPLVRLLGASVQSAPYAAVYIRTLAAFSVCFLSNNVLVALVRNDGNPRLAMTSMVTCSLSNVALDYIFIIRLGWGMFGAAFATGLAPVIGMCILSLHWLRGHHSLHLRGGALRPRLLPAIVRSGCANGITELGGGAVILLFNAALMGMSGDLAVAAYGIVANIALVIANLFVGIGQGLQPIASRLHGQGDTDGTRRLLRMALLVAGVLGAVFCAIGQLLPAHLTAVFNSENDPQLAAITVRAIRLYFPGFLFMGLNICFCSWLQAVLRPRPAAALSLLRAFALIVAGVAVLPRLWGLDGIWLIVPAAEFLTLLCCAAVYSGVLRKQAVPGTTPA